MINDHIKYYNISNNIIVLNFKEYYSSYNTIYQYILKNNCNNVTLQYYTDVYESNYHMILIIMRSSMTK